MTPAKFMENALRWERRVGRFILYCLFVFIVCLFFVRCAPMVHADTLTAAQRARVEQIVDDARKVNVQLDSALADQVGAHLGMLAAQTAADAAQKEAVALRAQVARTTAERDTARAERDALHASRWRWLAFGIVAGIVLPYALRFGIRSAGLLAKYGWLAAV